MHMGRGKCLAQSYVISCIYKFQIVFLLIFNPYFNCYDFLFSYLLLDYTLEVHIHFYIPETGI